ncbi:hypothetical protein [Acinetobacter sp. 256-1]|nr:hypothetical protein [Acinetobacter sp. 256-1]
MNTDLLIHGERIQGAGEAVAVLNPATALLHKPICKGFFSDIIFK